MMSPDPLQYLPPERWCELQRAFRKDWPRRVSGYSLLAMQKQWVDRRIPRSKGSDFGFNVYCPFGDVQNGMVAVCDGLGPFKLVIIHCPTDDVTNLETALKKTKIIDWKIQIIFPYTQYDMLDLVKSILPDINMEEELFIPSATFILDTKETYQDVNLPTGMTFELLTKEYIDLIDSTWPHRYPGSPKYFDLLIEGQYGYGLRLNNVIICWCLINESGNLLHMYTVKEHRQKGYAELMLKLVSNVLIEDGKIVSAYCLEDNYNAIKLYKKAGFVRIKNVAWMYLRSTVNSMS